MNLQQWLIHQSQSNNQVPHPLCFSGCEWKQSMKIREPADADALPGFFIPLLSAAIMLLVACSRSSDDIVLATVNRKPITLTEVETEARRRGLPEAGPSLERVLREIVQRKALAERARESGLDTDPEVKAQVESILETHYREQLEANIIKVSTIPEIELRQAYQERIAEFTTPARIRAACIQLELSSDPQAHAAAHKLAADLHAELQSSSIKERETKFPDFAASYSADQASRYRKGDIGYLSAGGSGRGFPPQMLDALFSLKSTDEIPEPVDTGTGIYLLRLVELHSAQIESFEEVAPALQRRLVETHLETARTSGLEKAMENLVIMYPERLPEITNTSSTTSPPPAPR